ncbi:MAG: protease HtpX [Candidatus Pacearchaeota archaeon]|nr:MAG: protease HtpX [Candidatus Pacearchaeota archaeon]
MWNQIKTVLFLAILTAILLFFGSFFGRVGLTIAIIFALSINFITYFFSDRIALFMYRAKPIKKDKYQWLINDIKQLSKEAKIPEPKGIYIIPTEQANAFCAGRGPKHYVVACTEGILKILDKEELRAVLAHEIAHAKNRDVLIATIAATIAGVISYLAHMAQFAAIFGGRDNERSASNIIGLLILAILTPIIALIIQLAISRTREYHADETGAKIIRNGKPLASALEKIEKSVKSSPLNFGSEAASSLFISNPFKRNALLNLFSTHPPVEARIKRLKEMNF